MFITRLLCIQTLLHLKLFNDSRVYSIFLFGESIPLATKTTSELMAAGSSETIGLQTNLRASLRDSLNSASAFVSSFSISLTAISSTFLTIAASALGFVS